MKIDNYLHNTLLFGVLRAGTVISERLSKLFSPAKLNYIQALILIAISREKIFVRPKNLQEAFSLSSGTVSQAITHLEKMKYLDRRISSLDARGYELILTTKGRTQANRLISFIESLERDVEKAVGIAKGDSCLQTLRAVLIAVEE